MQETQEVTPPKQPFPEPPTQETECVDLRPRIPFSLKLLCALALILMANQLKLPVEATSKTTEILAKISISELAFIAAFIPTAFYFFSKRLTLHLPWLCVLPVIAMAASNILAGTRLQGAIETAQLAMMLVGGVSLFAFMYRDMPLTTLVAVTLGLVSNLIVALIQDIHSGAFLTLAPKDVVELKYGVGAAMTGLFRSKIAFSLYLAATMAWLFPQWIAYPIRKPIPSMLRYAICISVAAWAIFAIPYAPLTLLAAFIIIVAGFASRCFDGICATLAVALALLFAVYIPGNLHLEAWKATISPLKGYDYIPDAKVLFNQTKPIISSDVSYSAHELKTCHYDFAAAIRLACENPLSGVGSGNYQKRIGKAYSINEEKRYGQLPKPVLNDIETDSQAGWGILLATLGFPATIAFALMLVAAIGANAKRITEDLLDYRQIHLGSTLALVVFALAMFITDPLTKGIGWYLALAIASAVTSPRTRQHSFTTPWNEFNPWKLLILFAVVALAIVATAFAPKSNDEDHMLITPSEHMMQTEISEQEQLAQETSDEQSQDGEKQDSVGISTPANKQANAPAEVPENATQPQTEDKPAEQPTPQQNEVDPALVLVAPENEDLFLLFNMDKATQVTMPMRKAVDENGDFSNGLLVIPDGTGVPPAGKNPALEHGGAVFHFEVKQETTAYLWFNVMWDGSCGNTLDVKVDDDKMSYTVGNDGTYNAWHWQKSPKSYKLTPGRHKITVLNREDGIKLAQVLLLQDKEYIPEGVEEQ